MAASAPDRPRRGPAPIASFDHDVSDESSPESKQTFQLPEIREDPAFSGPSEGGGGLTVIEGRARSHSTPAAALATPTAALATPAAALATPAAALATPAAPRIDISRASSSSHHDSRDSSPELALFAGAPVGEDARLGFREDGALDLRSSTEELAFLEGAPGEPRAAPRRASRKDSQGSEAALLGVSGRTSRLSSVGSQCSAHSAVSAFSHVSHVSRLSVVSGVSRSPSPHRMLLETSFCGPKPIETDPEVCAAAVEERLLEMAKMSAAPPVDARDRREVRTEVTVESEPPPAAAAPDETQHEDKRQKENKNRARVEERRARPRVRREPSEPEVYKSGNRSKDIIRIRLKPEDDYEDDPEDSEIICAGSSANGVTGSRTNGAGIGAATNGSVPGGSSSGPGAARPTELAPASPGPPSSPPAVACPPVSRKSSFCSLFKSRETITSPDSPDVLRRKRSLTEGRSRSKSRDRSATPTSALSSGKLRGSVLSLFRGTKRGASSPSGGGSRDGSPGQPPRPLAPAAAPRARSGERLKYYENTKDGIIHIPLRTPPNERPSSSAGRDRDVMETVKDTPREVARPASAPVTAARPAVDLTSSARPAADLGVSARPAADPVVSVQPAADPVVSTRPAADPVALERPAADLPVSARSTADLVSTTRPATVLVTTPSSTRTPVKPIKRTVLPDGSIIIPLRSPTEKTIPDDFLAPLKREDELTSVVNAVDAEVEVITSPLDRAAADGAEASPDREPAEQDEAQEERASPPSAGRASPPSAGRASPPSAGRASPPSAERASPAAGAEEAGGSRRRKERLVFTTHVGSRDQVFSTQFSLTKTPSVTSEISGSFPSFVDGEELRGTLRDTHITSSEGGGDEAAAGSSGSEAGSEGARAGNDVERRGLVVHESFDEELPYVPTTLPLERSLALPMVPVRERAAPRVAGLERPRAPAQRAAHRAPPAPAPPPPAPASAPADKLRIRLPRRARTASLAPAGEPVVPPRISRPRTRSGGDGAETRTKTEWIDFEEVPERRKQPKRIQTLPAGSGGVGGGGGAEVFSYVEPEQCRCECHARADGPPPDPSASSSPLEAEAAGVHGTPFSADLALHSHAHDSEAGH